jgi:hypothetical protein
LQRKNDGLPPLALDAQNDRNDENDGNDEALFKLVITLKLNQGSAFTFRMIGMM